MKKGAKKKEEVKAVKATHKAKPNYTGWIIAAIVVIAIIAWVMMKPAQVAPTTAPTQEVATTGGKVAKATSAPEELKACDLNSVIGVVTKSCVKVDGDATIPIKNSGKGAIPGMWFYVTADDGKVSYFRSSEALNVGEVKEYTLELASWSSEMGSAVKTVKILPMTSDGKACLNQQSIVIASSCK